MENKKLVRNTKYAGSMATFARREWSFGCVRDLHSAAISPARRREALRAALSGIGRGLSASGVAFVRPGDGVHGWNVEYVGENEAAVGNVIRSLIHPDISSTAMSLCSANGAGVSVVHLDRCEGGSRPFLVVAGCGGADLGSHIPEDVKRALRTIVSVEHFEQDFVGEAGLGFAASLSRSLGRSNDPSEMLALSKDVSGADFTYWGSVHEGVVDVESNCGARDSDFGFELPLGEGIGGRAFARGEAFEVEDYLNCQYRYPGVSEATDSEEVRTALAVPIHAEGSGAVLYAVRREVEAFSPARIAMLMQVRDAIEPVVGKWRSPARLYPSGLDHLRLQKSGLRKLLLESDHVHDIESWLARLLKGSAIVVDGSGHPYVPTNLPQLEKLETESTATRHDLPLPDGRASGGKLCIWTNLDIPLEGWPDLTDDVLAALGVVIDRVEQAHERVGRQLSHWLRSVASGGVVEDLRRDGTRLGLPVKNGEVWAFAWGQHPDQPRLGMLAADMVLDLLGGPLISAGDSVGVVLLREPCSMEPSAVRDELLRHVGPSPLWLAHGASYDSLECLRNALGRATVAATNLRRSQTVAFVTEVDGRNLDSLLGNPALTEELAAFSGKLLAPLTDHDARRNSNLTETFCRTLTLGSPAEAAGELYIHPNTVRYRMRQASGILASDLEDPRERTALSLAAFVWLGERFD